MKSILDQKIEALVESLPAFHISRCFSGLSFHVYSSRNFRSDNLEGYLQLWIFHYHHGASFRKDCKLLRGRESLVYSVSKVSGQALALEGGSRGWWVRRTQVSVDRFIRAATFQEKANGTLGARCTEKRQKGLVFLPIPPLVGMPAVHSDLHLHS